MRLDYSNFLSHPPRFLPLSTCQIVNFSTSQLQQTKVNEKGSMYIPIYIYVF